MQTLTNEFHHTEYRTRFTDEELQQIELDYVSACDDRVRQRARRAIQRIRRVLCGIKGCTCGDTFGRRP